MSTESAVVNEPAAVPAVVPATATPIATAVVNTPDATPAPVTDSAPVVAYKFTPVEGVDPEFDKQVADVATKLKWTNEQAEAFRAHELELAKTERAADEAAAAATKLANDQQLAKWDAENKAHKDFGGPKYDETTIKINKLLAEYGPKSGFDKLIAESPALLKQPAFRSFLAELSYAHGEASFVQAGNHATSALTDAQLFYGASK